MSNFSIEQKVICIDEVFNNIGWASVGVIAPKKDTIYTVRGFGFTGGILLAEIVNKYHNLKSGRIGEPAFIPDRFRPLDETFTHETIAMLNEHFETLKVTI